VVKDLGPKPGQLVVTLHGGILQHQLGDFGK